MANVVISGLKELDKMLRELPEKLNKKVIRGAMRRALAPLKKAVQDNAPMGESGMLKKVVKIRSAKKKRNSFGVAVQINQADLGDKWYAVAQEWGTSKIEGKGFMRRAADEKGDEAAKSAIADITEAILQEFRKLP
jgi:HK97 gp10 family phage protein